MIKWTVYNLSEVDASVESTLSVPPHTTKAFHPASSSSTLRLAHHTFSLTTHPSKSWRRLLPLPNLSPTEKPLRFLLKAFQHRQTIVLLSTPPLHSWMSSLPDDLSLGDVTLPGTHQSTALYGVPVSQCQQPGTPLKVQLVDGIRFLDIRLAEIKGKLIAYHGILTQRATFDQILAEVKDFLTSPESNRETIIMSINQENSFTELFISLMKGYIEASDRTLWYLTNRIPTLSEVRGKIVLFSRFGGDIDSWTRLGGRGIHPVGWRDSVRDGFEIALPDRPSGLDDGRTDGWGWTLGISDWYDIGTMLSIPEKADSVQTTLTVECPLGKHLPLVFCSASSFPFAFPATVARGFGWPRWGLGVEGVNDRMTRWLLDRLAQTQTPSGAEKRTEGRVRGWLLFDFYRDPISLVDLVVAFNRFEGQGV